MPASWRIAPGNLRWRCLWGVVPLVWPLRLASLLLTLSLLTLWPVFVVHGASAAREHEPIVPVRPAPPQDPALVALGERLFNEPRLSRDGAVSCASCHLLHEGGDDNRVVSLGVDGTPGVINSPTVFNAGLSVAQFWDGRAPTLEAQIDGPIQAPIEMGMLWPDVVSVLRADVGYYEAFAKLWPTDPDPVSRAGVKLAIASFMRSLRTVGSPFDQWLQGDDSALTQQELFGYETFKRFGCVSCHQGEAVGGNFFQVFGVLNNYFQRRGNITAADLGRFNLTGNEEDRHKFKVPSLRMAAHTAPYLHDGTAATLREAVDAMFEFQLGRASEGTDDEREAIVAFIRTLAGPLPSAPQE